VGKKREEKKNKLKKKKKGGSANRGWGGGCPDPGGKGATTVGGGKRGGEKPWNWPPAHIAREIRRKTGLHPAKGDPKELAPRKKKKPSQTCVNEGRKPSRLSDKQKKESAQNKLRGAPLLSKNTHGARQIAGSKKNVDTQKGSAMGPQYSEQVC